MRIPQTPGFLLSDEYNLRYALVGVVVPAGVFVFELSSGKKTVETKTPLTKIGVALSISKLRTEPETCRVEEEQGFQKPCRLPSQTEHSPCSEA